MQWVVEDCLCLDANKLAKNKWFRGTYQSGTMTWSSGANINLVYCRRSSTLELRYNLDGEAHPRQSAYRGVHVTSEAIAITSIVRVVAQGDTSCIVLTRVFTAGGATDCPTSASSAGAYPV